MDQTVLLQGTSLLMAMRCWGAWSSWISILACSRARVAWLCAAAETGVKQAREIVEGVSWKEGTVDQAHCWRFFMKSQVIVVVWIGTCV